MWKFLSIRDCLVQNAERTSPNMKVMELLLLPLCLGQEIIWAEACGRIRNLVVEIGSILDCHGPQVGVRDFWLMCSVEHHSSCNRHDSLDGLFYNSIVVMCSNSSKMLNLREIREMGSIGLGGEGSTILRDGLQRDNTSILAFQLKVLFGLES